MRVDAEILVPAKPEEVWRRLLVWELQPLWMSDAASVRVLTPHREGSGVRVAVRTRVLGVPVFTETLEVTLWDPPRRLRLAHGSLVRGFGEWTLQRAGEGTLFRWTERLSMPVPILGELALLSYRPLMARLMKRSLQSFQDWLDVN
jgi:polyketide cyclase/dehydrase/lipid transport protein